MRLIEFTVSKNTKHKGRYRLCEEDQVWVDGSEVDSELPPWLLLNDDNDENRSEGYGSVRRRLVKKAKRVDSFYVEAMAFVGYHGSLRVYTLEPFASSITKSQWKNANRKQAATSTQRSLLTQAMEDGKFDIYHETTATMRGPGCENSGGELNFDISQYMLKGETKANDGCGNKVMVVVDLNMESKGAFHWALDDTVQNQDTMIR
ncbi:hypothetical protein Tco_0226080 [Tanacetum coccineum]